MLIIRSVSSFNDLVYQINLLKRVRPNLIKKSNYGRISIYTNFNICDVNNVEFEDATNNLFGINIWFKEGMYERG